jgi:hypothetical protein
MENPKSSCCIQEPSIQVSYEAKMKLKDQKESPRLWLKSLCQISLLGGLAVHPGEIITRSPQSHTKI